MGVETGIGRDWERVGTGHYGLTFLMHSIDIFIFFKLLN